MAKDDRFACIIGEISQDFSSYIHVEKQAVGRRFFVRAVDIAGGVW
jgi:hypothetical protein